MGVKVRVAVVDPLPLFQRGVVATLASDDLVVEAPTDLLAWLRPSGRQVILLTLASSQEWSLLEQLGRLPSAPDVVAMIDPATTDLALDAIRSGAVSVLPRHSRPADLQETIHTALAGRSVLPTAVLRTLAAGDHAAPAGETRSPPAEQLEWLKALAAGTTVARLATNAGYSERAMFRLLRKLYTQMGARSRTEALIQAQERGWLAPGTDPHNGADRPGNRE